MIKTLARSLFLAACVLCASAALAETRVLTFDTNAWGTATWGAFNTTVKFETTGGNPGHCVRFHGIAGLGGSFVNQGFTGDFAAAGFSKISMDLKAVQWFLRQDNARPKGFIFVRAGNDKVPWCREIANFAPSKTEYKAFFVTFDPTWSDSQAQAAGWFLPQVPGATETVPFAETFRSVYQTGFWIEDTWAECSVLVDNWTLGQGIALTEPVKSKVRMDPKRRVQPFPVVPGKTKQ